MTKRSTIIPMLALLASTTTLVLAGCDSPPDLSVTEAEEADSAHLADFESESESDRQATDLPEGHPPIEGTPPTGMPPATAGGAGIGWTTPDGWVEEPPANPMRLAQYRIPGPAGDAELVVFSFGPGQGGDPQANADRWAAQFTTPDGMPAEAETDRLSSDGLEILRVEVRGTYDPGTMSGPAAGPRPGSMLLGAVVEGPRAYWFFKLTGPEETVAASEAGFDELLASIEPGA